MSRASLLRIALIAGLGSTLGCVIPAGPAAARVFVGVGIPFFPPPIYYPPPVYYPPPPVYYAPPPPVMYTPAPTYAPRAGYGQTCYAGPYTCPMDRPTAAGAACYCLGNGGARVWGQAN